MTVHQGKKRGPQRPQATADPAPNTLNSQSREDDDIIP